MEDPTSEIETEQGETQTIVTSLKSSLKDASSQQPIIQQIVDIMTECHFLAKALLCIYGHLCAEALAQRPENVEPDSNMTIFNQLTILSIFSQIRHFSLGEKKHPRVQQLVHNACTLFFADTENEKRRKLLSQKMETLKMLDWTKMFEEQSRVLRVACVNMMKVSSKDHQVLYLQRKYHLLKPDAKKIAAVLCLSDEDRTSRARQSSADKLKHSAYRAREKLVAAQSEGLSNEIISKLEKAVTQANKNINSQATLGRNNDDVAYEDLVKSKLMRWDKSTRSRTNDPILPKRPAGFIGELLPLVAITEREKKFIPPIPTEPLLLVYRHHMLQDTDTSDEPPLFNLVTSAKYTRVFITLNSTNIRCLTPENIQKSNRLTKLIQTPKMPITLNNIKNAALTVNDFKEELRQRLLANLTHEEEGSSSSSGSSGNSGSSGGSSGISSSNGGSGAIYYPMEVIANEVFKESKLKKFRKKEWNLSPTIMTNGLEVHLKFDNPSKTAGRAMKLKARKETIANANVGIHKEKKRKIDMKPQNVKLKPPTDESGHVEFKLPEGTQQKDLVACDGGIYHAAATCSLTEGKQFPEITAQLDTRGINDVVSTKSITSKSYYHRTGIKNRNRKLAKWVVHEKNSNPIFAASLKAVEKAETRTINTDKLVTAWSTKYHNFSTLYEFYGSNKAAMVRFSNYQSKQRVLTEMVKEILPTKNHVLIVGDAFSAPGPHSMLVKKAKETNTVLTFNEFRTSVLDSISLKPMFNPPKKMGTSKKTGKKYLQILKGIYHYNDDTGTTRTWGRDMNAARNILNNVLYYLKFKVIQKQFRRAEDMPDAACLHYGYKRLPGRGAFKRYIKRSL